MSILPIRRRQTRTPVPAHRRWQSARQAPEPAAPTPEVNTRRALAAAGATRPRVGPATKPARPAVTPAAPPPAIRSIYAVDYPLVAIVAILLALGLVEVFTGSMLRAQTDYGQPAYFFIRQVGWVVVGAAAMFAMARIPYYVWQRWAIPVMTLALILLVAVLAVGSSKFGAQRTFLNGSIQPSEVTKLAVVIYVAAWMASKKDRLTEIQGGLIPFAVLMGIVASLVMRQNSYSVTLIILATGTAMFFVGGGSVKQLALTGLICLVLLSVPIWTSENRMNRVNTWISAISDPSQASYDVAQANAVLRRGGGIDTTKDNFIAKGNATLLWSDYIFANVGADWSFPGTLGVVVLFAALGYRGLTIALSTSDPFASLCAVGITTWILVQALIHMGASLVLIPTTGVPLPFMSYGGSAMVSAMAAMGLLLSISRSIREKRAPHEGIGFGGRDRGARLPDPGHTQRPATDASNKRRRS